MNALDYDLDGNGFNRISFFKANKKVLDTFISSYEGMCQVKSWKINIYVQQYELLKMLSNEGIKEMYISYIMFSTTFSLLE